jgi:hypothetical protein
MRRFVHAAILAPHRQAARARTRGPAAIASFRTPRATAASSLKRPRHREHWEHSHCVSGASIGHETFARKARSAGQMPLRRRNKFGFYAVADYRLYRLDGVRKVSSAHDLAADDDDAAIEAAKSRYQGYECELWRGKRLVARLDLR